MAITLLAALFALAAKDANNRYVWIAGLVIPAFWALDAFYLSIERQYRALFDTVAAKPDTDDIDFNMNASCYNTGVNTWPRSVISLPVLLFYGICIAGTILVWCFLNR